MGAVRSDRRAIGAQTVCEQRAILDAIVLRDGEAAEGLISAHVGGAGTLIIRMLHEKKGREDGN